MKQHGHKAPYRWLLADGEQVNLLRGPRWSTLSCSGARPRPICTVGLEVCCDDALCFVGRCGRAFENDRAEPDLRMVKLRQEIAGCKASEDLQSSA